MRARRSVPIILIALLCCGAASASGKKASLKGRIVAYRPADRMQVVSSVANKELLLFQIDGARRDLLKIVYVHQGFSDLKGDVLSGTQDISISVRRDASCEQTLAAFLKEAQLSRLKVAVLPRPLRESFLHLRRPACRNPIG